MGIRLVAVTDGFDTGNGDGMGAMVAPYGYLKSKENKNRFVVDGTVAPVVRRIFRLYADGASIDKIVRILDGDGLDCPRKYRYRIGVTKSERYKDSRWGRSAVRTILTNRAYIGDMVQGILEERQREQAKRREKSRISEHKEENYLKGYMRCGHCGKTFNLSQTMRDGKVTRVYYCRGYQTLRSAVCMNNKDRVDKAEVERFVLGEIKGCIRQMLKEGISADGDMPAERESLEAEVRKAERALKGRQGMKEPGADAESLRAEMRRMDEAKISGYEDYKAGKLSRERFVERKRELDARRQELYATVSEAEAREIVEEAGQREYREAFRIGEYLHLEGYDKRVVASLIESAKVMGEDRLEVVWKFGDVYEKILGEMR